MATGVHRQETQGGLGLEVGRIPLRPTGLAGPTPPLQSSGPSSTPSPSALSPPGHGKLRTPPQRVIVGLRGKACGISQPVGAFS